MMSLLTEALDAAQLSMEDIDWLVPHQSNLRMIQSMSEKTGFPMDKVICTVAKHSNTSSASIPLALTAAFKEGRIQSGQKLLLMGFGAGLTWGAVLITMP
jgi:3-oxoacyl-[acyl-carrier-protein] synthase-3